MSQDLLVEAKRLPPSTLPLSELEKSVGTLRRVLGEMGVGWEWNVLGPLKECFVQRSVAPMLPWGIFESSQVTDD